MYIFAYKYCSPMLKEKKILIFDLGGVLIDLHVERSFGALVAMGADPSLLTEKACLLNMYLITLQLSLYYQGCVGKLKVA